MENKYESTYSISSFKFFFFRFRAQLTSPEVWLDNFVTLSLAFPSPQDLSCTGGRTSVAETSSEDDAFELRADDDRLDSLAARATVCWSVFDELDFPWALHVIEVLNFSWNLLHVIREYGLRRTVVSLVLDSIKFDTTNSLFCWSRRVTQADDWLQ